MALPENDWFFRRTDYCAGCDEAILPEQNWGCAHALIPVFGPVEMGVEIHQHLHIGCAEGHMKWLALSSLGRSRRELN